MSVSWSYWQCFYRACYWHMVCCLSQACTYAARLGVWACLDYVVHLNGSVSVYYLAKAYTRGLPLYSFTVVFVSVGAKCTLELFVFRVARAAAGVVRYCAFARGNFAGYVAVLAHKQTCRILAGSIRFVGCVCNIFKLCHLATELNCRKADMPQPFLL